MTTTPAHTPVPTSALSGAIILEDASVSPPAEDQALFFVASSLMPGVMHLGQAENIRCEALILISGQTAECLLKAIIIKSGEKSKLLKQQNIRHNLTELWDQAVKACLTLESTAPLWLKEINEFFDAPYVIRYMRGVSFYSLPLQRPLLEGLKDLFAKTEKYLGRV